SSVVVSTDAGNGTQVLLQVQGNNAGAAVVQGTIATFVDVNLQTGQNQQNTLTAQCTDQAGNPGTGTATVTVNVTIPTITITDPAPNTTIASNIDPATFSVSVATQLVDPGQLATLKADGNLVATTVIDASGNGVFTNVQLSEGNHTLQAFTQDLAGTP